MSARSKILGPNGLPVPATPNRLNGHNHQAIKSRYDAAQLSRETRDHWVEADPLSAKAANSVQVRFRLRTRARYEISNNSYARGIVETLANDTVGTGPRLQLLTDDPGANRETEAAFQLWSSLCRLPEKLRTCRKARAEDGEAFARLTTNPALDGPVKLDVRLYEADQVASPAYYPFDPQAEDGIRYDAYGNPSEYHVLPYHPGDISHIAPYGQFERVPAGQMCHWFRCDRPGQLRGIPDVTPALPLFAQLRRYTLAVIAAAETAADFAAVVQTNMPPDNEAMLCEPWDHLEIDRRTMTTLPAGWTMNQFRPEQPATTYEMFKHEILNEIARCLNMPFNVAAGNSSAYNYSSGRLDHQTYYKTLSVDRNHLERVVLDPILSAWLDEARLAAPGLVPEGPGLPPHAWMWDGPSHVDPEKEANAQKTRLETRTTSYAREYAREGRDWEAEFRQIAAEQTLLKSLGIAPPAAAAARPGPPGAPAPGAPGEGPPERETGRDEPIGEG